MVGARHRAHRQEEERGEQREQALAHDPHAAEARGPQHASDRLWVERGLCAAFEQRRLDGERAEAGDERGQDADPREGERVPLPALRRGPGGATGEQQQNERSGEDDAARKVCPPDEQSERRHFRPASPFTVNEYPPSAT